MWQMESREYIFIALQGLYQYVLRVIQLHSTRLDRSEHIFTIKTKFGPNLFKNIFIESVLRRKFKYGYFPEKLSTCQPFVDHGEYIFRYIKPVVVRLDSSENMLNLLLKCNENIFI